MIRARHDVFSKILSSEAETERILAKVLPRSFTWAALCLASTFYKHPALFVVVFSSEIGLLFGIICTHMNGHVRTSNLKGRWFLGVHQAKKRGRDNEEAATSSTSSSTSSASDGSKSIFSKLKVPQIPV